MESPKILTLGKYSPRDLSASVSESTRQIDEEVESQIESAWQAIEEKARQNGQVYYNRTSYRLNSLKEVDGKVSLGFGIFEYKVREGLIKVPGYFDLSEEFYRKGCSTMASIKTRDDRYLMVELSGKSMNRNKLDLLGGIMETNVEMKTGEDIFESLFIELQEEGCIERSDIAESYLRAIFLGVSANVGFYFEIVLNVSSADLLDRFEKGNKDPDIKSLKICSKDRYIEELRNHKSKNKQFVVELFSLA